MDNTELYTEKSEDVDQIKTTLKHYDVDISSEDERRLTEFKSLLSDILSGDELNTDRISAIWRSIANHLYDMKDKYEFDTTEYENQLRDLEHYLVIYPPNSDEYKNALLNIPEVSKLRRQSKDWLSYVTTASINCAKISNYVGRMNTRSYTPRSKRYSNTLINREEPVVITSNTTVSTSVPPAYNQKDTVMKKYNAKQPSHVYKKR